MQRALPHLVGAIVLAGLLAGCATRAPTGAVVALYQEAMAAAARPPTRADGKPAPLADRAVQAVADWRGVGSGGAAAARQPQPAPGQLE